MTNVVRLSDQKKAEIVLLEPKTCIAAATTGVMASTAQLNHTIRELLEQFAALDHAIDAIDDTETRIQLKPLTRLSRETLSEGLIKLSQEIRKIADPLKAPPG
jgi:hypothetical protein